ncbi:MAG: hypothetical protein KGH72_05575, partial [Candidatus Micrarchaeota archaeon]|nr:hypothetical protein [Candidatus Micrarchaeota archaeon]
HMIGKGEPGRRDGSFRSSEFSMPQGILWDRDRIYVADTGNHLVRVADLNRGEVSTMAGTGEKGRYVKEGFVGVPLTTSINSPWDLALLKDRLFIAMAGFNQIWYLDLKKRRLGPFAGTGHENITDGEFYDAEFAQPSGISISGNDIFIADSEASAVRSISLKEKFVSTLTGSGLFIYGDKDGDLGNSRMQHPLGIDAHGDFLYVADTYNSAVKEINIRDKTVMTLVGAKSHSVCRFDDPECDTLGLYEPSDVKLNGKKLYIVDTNNNMVRIFDLETKLLDTLKLVR